MAEQAQQYAAELAGYLREKNYRAYAEKWLPPGQEEAELDAVVSEMEMKPDYVTVILGALDQASLMTPDLVIYGNYAVFQKLKRFPQEPENPAIGHLILQKWEEGWFMHKMVDGEFDERRFKGKLIASNSRAVPQEIWEFRRLKKVLDALHEYLEEHGHFPADIYSADGKPLLSWRVAILPYLREEALYKEFHLDEPWDSEHNLSLGWKIPVEYQFIVEGKKTGGKTLRTHVMAPKGQGTVLGHKDPVPLARITDGASNTLMLVVAPEPVEWTKPGDLEFDPRNPAALLFFGKMESVIVGYVDGRMTRIPKSVAPETWLNLFVRDDGELVPEF